jgi:hypothetical protein
MVRVLAAVARLRPASCRRCKGRQLVYVPVRNGSRYQLVCQPCPACRAIG